jgi:hypothetical protein
MVERPAVMVVAAPRRRAELVVRAESTRTVQQGAQGPAAQEVQVRFPSAPAAVAAVASSAAAVVKRETPQMLPAAVVVAAHRSQSAPQQASHTSKVFAWATGRS